MRIDPKKGLGVALCAALLGAGAVGCGTGAEAVRTEAEHGGGDDGGDGGSVSAHLGGREGILGFLRQLAVPALLADPEIAPFFTSLTESPDDIEQCLANLLDHDLGGRSPKNGAVLASGHVCRSSMSDVHRRLAIPDRIVTKFIVIVGQQAALAGVAAADIQEVAKVLESYRGSVRAD
jgi:hypothetical protein